MYSFTVGQRWVVDSEPELGLGIVTLIRGRTVNIFFESADCERTYAIDQAPLTRIRFNPEDEIKINDGSSQIVQKVHETNGLLSYESEDGAIVPETALASETHLNQPFLRLLTGQVDHPNWFTFKRQLGDAISRVWKSRLNGLLGIRANLIPHQLYVAWSACEHARVRVLLADEVGLGKTIEAGMILLRLIKLERIHRGLIVVPTALQVQWLVEMIRRFSLTAEIYKEEDHDFSSGQMHIISHEVFTKQHEAILEAQFDIAVIDEAHHLTPDGDAFAALEKLARQTEHLVLLSATPEQLGIDSHFARLQLLDPAKFTSLETFIDQEDAYVELNRRIRDLPQKRKQLIDDFKLNPTDSDEKLIGQLLDSHGVGRVVFRNVRSAVKGFPQRYVVSHELANDDWETKFEWLAVWLKNNSDTKALVICHHVETVFECENYLWKKHGIDAATFHEQQSLIERDKAAAYFSSTEEGTQVLLCSEIGSEGRNFQFVSHLVCLDLPEHPDLLEQRIGRLDRIGQQGDVNIHVPYAPDSASEKLFLWYQEVLECMEDQNPAAGVTHDQFWPKLKETQDWNIVTKKARQHMQGLRDNIRQGRDALLEMNSCRQPFADQLAEKIQALEEHSPLELIELASDLLQFHFEESSRGAYSLIPSDTTLIPSLPGIPAEGCEVTFDREVANRREELRFISWDAPFIQGLWETLHFSELGSASVAVLSSQQLPAGHCLLEACFDLVVQSDVASVCRPFLENLTVRSLALDVSDKDLSSALSEEALQNSIKGLNKKLAREVINSKKEDIPSWFKRCENFAEIRRQAVVESAENAATDYYDGEVQRLEQLKLRNAFVDEMDILALKTMRQKIVDAFRESTHLHLATIRLIVVTAS